MSRSQTPPPFLTTKEVAELLRVRERKVYDLAAADEIPYRRVTGKLLFPRAEIEAWLSGGAPARTAPSDPRPNVIAGSSDPLLEWALRESGCGLASLFDGSLDGLERYAGGEACACGLHLWEGGEAWNVESVAERVSDGSAALIAWARRRQGVIMRPEAAAGLADVSDLRSRRVAARQPKAGARLLLERLLAAVGIGLEALDLVDPPPRTEAEAAEHVAEGKADAAIGLESMAARAGLGFVPLIEERFDLLVDRRAYFEPPFQALMAFTRGAGFAGKAADLAGYDVAECGRVRWNGGAA